LKSKDATTFVSQFSGKHLKGEINTSVGETKVDLHRSNFTDHKGMNAVIEGSSHNFIAEVFRLELGADLGVLRGFRYGTHVAKGEIAREDIFHYIPISPFVGVWKISGKQLFAYLEKAVYGSLAPDPSLWTGGWNHDVVAITRLKAKVFISLLFSDRHRQTRSHQ